MQLWLWVLIAFNPSMQWGLFRSSYRRCSIKKRVLKNIGKFTGKQLCWSLFNKVAGWRSTTLLKKRLRHWCFPVSFAKFLRTIFLQNTSFMTVFGYLSLPPWNGSALKIRYIIHSFLASNQCKIPSRNYMLKVNKRNTRARCEIYSKLIIKARLLLTLNIFLILLLC